jgi:monovalent cation:H+ antiporter, CPA1 family
MLDTAFVLLVIAVFLVVVGLCQPLAAYLKLPPPVLLGVVGVVLGGFPLLMSKLRWSGGTDVFADAFAALPGRPCRRPRRRCLFYRVGGGRG